MSGQQIGFAFIAAGLSLSARVLPRRHRFAAGRDRAGSRLPPVPVVLRARKRFVIGRRHEESHEDAPDHRRTGTRPEADCCRLREHDHSRLGVSSSVLGIDARGDAAETDARNQRLGVADYLS